MAPFNRNMYIFWLHWVFIAFKCRLSLAAASRASSIARCVSSHCGGFSGCRAWVLGPSGFSRVQLAGSRSCDSRTYEHGLSSCATWAYWLTAWAIFPRLGLNLCPLHLQADCYPLWPPGKSWKWIFINQDLDQGYWCVTGLSQWTYPGIKHICTYIHIHITYLIIYKYV